VRRGDTIYLKFCLGSSTQPVVFQRGLPLGQQYPGRPICLQPPPNNKCVFREAGRLLWAVIQPTMAVGNAAVSGHEGGAAAAAEATGLGAGETATTYARDASC
jgi:hypothetical protein